MGPSQGLHACARAIGSAAAVVALLTGCADSTASLNPVDWWHELEGGKIAEQRPPPPNADAPYANLSRVPDRPVPTDAASRGRIAGGLLADRSNAAFARGDAPEPPATGRAPQAPGPLPPPPPAEADTPAASLQAANAQPAPPRPAPAPAPAAANAGPADVAPVDAGTLAIPAAPPPAPHVAGIDVPAITVPTPPPMALPAPPPLPKPVTTATAVAVAFQPGSAEIALESQNALRALVQRRGTAPLQAVGYGDAAGGDLAGQAAGLPLALSRARAIAAVLTASGVPAAQVQLQAEAEGSGGAARITN